MIVILLTVVLTWCYGAQIDPRAARLIDEYGSNLSESCRKLFSTPGQIEYDTLHYCEHIAYFTTVLHRIEDKKTRAHIDELISVDVINNKKIDGLLAEARTLRKNIADLFVDWEFVSTPTDKELADVLMERASPQIMPKNKSWSSWLLGNSMIRKSSASSSSASGRVDHVAMINEYDSSTVKKQTESLSKPIIITRTPPEPMMTDSAENLGQSAGMRTEQWESMQAELLESMEADCDDYGSLTASHTGKLLDGTLWKSFFNDDDVLTVDAGSMVKEIRTKKAVYTINKHIWTRLLGIRPWTMGNKQFNKVLEDLQRRYSGLCDNVQILDSCIKTIDKDIASMQLTNEEHQALLKRLLSAYLTENPQARYVTGLHILAMTCILLFGLTRYHKPQEEPLVYAIFSALLEKHLSAGFSHNPPEQFNDVGSMGITSMALIQAEDKELHALLVKKLGTQSLSSCLFSTYQLWLRNEVVDDSRLSRSGSIYTSAPSVLSMYSFFLAFPNPSRAVAVMVAVMLFKLKSKLINMAQEQTVEQVFKNELGWKWEQLMAECIRLNV